MMNTVKGYLSWTGMAAMAMPLWIGCSVSLGARFLINPLRYCRRVKRNLDDFPDAVPGIDHRYFEVNGVSLHAACHGLGTGKKLVVLLHGFPELWHSWRHQIEAFKDHYEVVALDMRGFGQSSIPKGLENFSMSKLINDVAAVVRAVGHSSCMLVGHDWGGAVAWCVAANYPEMVDRLAILCSPHPAAYKDPKRFNSKQAQRSSYFLLFMGKYLPEKYIRCCDYDVVQKMMSQPPMGPIVKGSITQQDIDRYKASLSRPGALTAGLNYYRASIRDQTTHPCLQLQKGIDAVLKMPVLLMYGDKDGAFYDFMFSDTDRNASHLKLIRLPNCSHWAQQDRHELVTAHLKEFFVGKNDTNTVKNGSSVGVSKDAFTAGSRCGVANIHVSCGCK